MSLLWLLGILAFAVGLMFSVALHEAGHLAGGKLFNVKVTQYMVGFGRTLWSTKRGETEYGIKAIPLGGYCRLVGMLPPGPEDEPETVRRTSTGWMQTMVADAHSAAREEIAHEDRNRVFYRKPWWQKLTIMTAGVAANFVLAVILVGIALMGFGLGQLQPTVSRVSECVLPASEQTRDCAADDPASPAALAGVQVGDRIVDIGGTSIATWDDAQREIRASEGPTDVTVVRDGAEVILRPDFLVTEVRVLEDNLDGTKTVDAGFLGVNPTGALVRQSPGETAVWIGDFVDQSVRAVAAIPSKIGSLWSAATGGERELDSPVGVVGAGRLGGEIASSDNTIGAKVSSLLIILAGVNMALGLVNLLPLLPLDGGHAIGAVWEGVKRLYARIRRRPEPAPVDVARLLPLAYAVASLFLALTLLLVWVDVVNPIRLPG